MKATRMNRIVPPEMAGTETRVRRRAVVARVIVGLRPGKYYRRDRRTGPGGDRSGGGRRHRLDGQYHLCRAANRVRRRDGNGTATKLSSPAFNLSTSTRRLERSRCWFGLLTTAPVSRRAVVPVKASSASTLGELGKSKVGKQQSNLAELCAAGRARGRSQR